MENRLEFITAKLKAISRIPYLLDSIENTSWDFTSVCRIFVDTMGYKSCWIALISDTGEISEFFIHAAQDLFAEVTAVPGRSSFNDFVKDKLVSPGDSILNEDPVLELVRDAGKEKINSVTIKLSYNNIIYGILSVTLHGDYSLIREEFLIISDVVKTISFFLYDQDFRNKIKDLFLSMFETTDNATALFDEDTTISYVNREFEKLSGYSKEEIEEKMSFTEFVHPDDVSKMIRYHSARRVDPGNAPRNYEFRFINRAGTVKNIYVTIDMVPRSKMSIASFKDITEKKRLESEILKISEMERQQIGDDLHDGLGPHLVGIQFLVKICRQQIAEGKMPTDSQVGEIDGLISQAIEQVRILAKGLRPVDITSDGLVFALNDLASKYSRLYGISCRVDPDERFLIEENIVATHLYYIVREAMNNAVKHGKPRSIEIRLGSDGDRLSVSISDDGAGLPNVLDTNAGLGLNIMRYRASIINASFDIRSGERGGTVVTCRLGG